jgi:hypothetical protein
MDTVPIRNSRDTRESRAASTAAASRIVMRLLLLAALAAATLALTQCQMVGDKLTGVQASVFKRRNDCVRKCADNRKDAEKAEKKRHHDLEKDCAGNSACLHDEQTRHNAAEAAIEAAYRACVGNCHNQGGNDHDDD